MENGRHRKDKTGGVKIEGRCKITKKIFKTKISKKKQDAFQRIEEPQYQSGKFYSKKD